jgi:2-polyprenyl-6-hydroxyphenyl methylase/3-demethylubiquinone-9 3-methyltransferase
VTEQVQTVEVRFPFGRNWQRFLEVVGEEHIAAARGSLERMTGPLAGLTFLDIGSGSGLSSLSAVRLGASRVHSFDFDPHSVACTAEMKRRFAPQATHWTVEQGSALDTGYLRTLGQWDVVYSWGVLHHSGQMWRALENVVELTKPGGTLYVTIYNDQGGVSRRWGAVKRIYNSGAIGKVLMSACFIPFFVARGLAQDLAHGLNPFARYRNYKRDRGMSLVYDWFDWLGGYPFEVARPEEIFNFYRDRGFELRQLITKGAGSGCNEFVFARRI